MRTGTRLLHLDIETYSEIDLKECGAYRYVDDPSFDILILGYAYDDDDVTVIDLAQGEKIPKSLLIDLSNTDIVKVAHNANFERTCLGKYLEEYMNPNQWLCTAVWASMLGLPRSLEAVGNALGLSEDSKKLKIGKTLIAYFSRPCKHTKSNGGRTRNLPKHDIAKWELYKDYNAQDIVAEREVLRKLETYPEPPEEEMKLWYLDQYMNERGVLVETKMVDNILSYYDTYRDKLLLEAQELSGLDNPGSISQAKQWLASKGIEAVTLDKEAVAGMVKKLKNSKSLPAVLKFLQIRQELGKTSVSKYEAIRRSLCSDRRIRGMLQFYGANRTGRWAGRIVQLQNLPQNHISDIEFARNLILNNEFELAEICYPSLMNLFSQLIRTALIARKDHTFIVADYSAIEARVIAWLANEKWVMDVFASHGKIYEAAASKMYHIPIEKVTKELRAKGKVSTLACGYGGGVGALSAMDSKGEIPEEEKQGIIDTWRSANPNIVQFWYDTEKSCISAILNPGSVLKGPKGIRYKMIKDTLFIKLPSGRSLAYKSARVVMNGKRKEIRYMGQNQKTQKWEEVSTYGGKIVENITQAVARDCLGYAMLRLAEKDLMPSFHIHDETVVEVQKNYASKCMKEIKEIMAVNEKWASGLILKAEAYETDYYMKD